jgi:hypothetical protein
LVTEGAWVLTSALAFTGIFLDNLSTCVWWPWFGLAESQKPHTPRLTGKQPIAYGPAQMWRGVPAPFLSPRMEVCHEGQEFTSSFARSAPQQPRRAPAGTALRHQ